MHRAASVLAAAIGALTLACSGDEEPARPTPTLFPQLETSPGPTTIPPPVPTQLPTLTEVPATTWLIDAGSGSVITLHEDPKHSLLFGAFDRDGISVIYDTIEGSKAIVIRKDLQGVEMERFHVGEGTGESPFALIYGPSRTTSMESGCLVDGRLYERVPCGSVSPDGRWMTYRANPRPVQPTGETWDLWSLELATGQTRELVAGLFQCTQCDAGPRQEWSASGRYFYTAEAGGDNRVFLLDLQTGVARVISVDAALGAPHFSPTADRIVRPAENGMTILEDLAAGTSLELTDIPWPAFYDGTGSYVYTASLGTGTQIADGMTGQLLATLPGVAG